jgi:hypothetical protein
MTAVADDAGDLPDTHASYHGVIAAKFFCFFFEQLSVFGLYASHFHGFHFPNLPGKGPCKYGKFSDNAVMSSETLSKEIQPATNQLTIPKAAMIRLQQDTDSHRWIKHAQPKGGNFVVTLRDLVDGERLSKKITVNAFREKFQAALADAT